jgi:hypothetical protein
MELVPGGPVLDPLEELTRGVLRIVQSPVPCCHSRRNALALQSMHDPPSVPVRCPRLDQPVELSAVGVTIRVVCEARIAYQVGAMHDGAQPPEFVVVRATIVTHVFSNWQR